MNATAYPAPPVGSRATLDITDGRLQVRLPARRFFTQEPLGCGAGAILIFVPLLLVPVLSLVLAPESVFLAVLLALLAIVILNFILVRCRPPLLEVTDDQLILRHAGLLPRRRWRRRAIRAIGCWQGLRIVSARSSDAFFEAWDREDLQWAAHVLRLALSVPQEPPLRQGETRVDHACTFWNQPEPAVLTASPGRMELRHCLADSAHLVFRARGESMFGLRPGGVLWLTEHDVYCRTEEDGQTALSVAPSDAYCAFDSKGTPFIRVGALGFLLYSQTDIPASVADVDKNSVRGTEFQLTIWCDDPEALPRALERFWSVKEQ